LDLTSGTLEEVHDVEFNETNGSQGEDENLEDVRGTQLANTMKKMDIGDIRSGEVIEVEEDKDQVQVSGSHDQNHASSSSQGQSHQQVASTSSLPNDQPSARNQVQVLQPSNVARDHPLDLIIGNISRGVQTRSRLVSFCEHFSFVSSIESKKIDEALKDVDWVKLFMKS
jgi:hypothetical protein